MSFRELSEICATNLFHDKWRNNQELMKMIMKNHLEMRIFPRNKQRMKKKNELIGTLILRKITQFCPKRGQTFPILLPRSIEKMEYTRWRRKMDEN